MNTKTSDAENGQALLLGAICMIALLGFTALAIDGGRIYSQERDAQNAADAAALAAARAMCTSGADVTTAARSLAAQGGYNNDRIHNWVTVDNPPRTGPYANMSYYAEIMITATLPSTMAHVVYQGPLQTTVHATGHCKPTTTIFANSRNCPNTINISDSSLTISGGMHSNNTIQISGGGQGNTINGTVTSVRGITYNANTTFTPSSHNPSLTALEAYPIVYNINDYMPGGNQANAAAERGQYYSCLGSGCQIDMNWLTANNLITTTNGSRVLSDGLYYTDGDIDLGGSSLVGNAVTFVARRGISFHGAAITLRPFSNHLLAFSDQSTGCGADVIDMSSSAVNLGEAQNNGNLYAPNGHVDLSGSSITLYGKLMGDSVDAHGSTITMNSDPTYFIELAK